jgi:hypothetical protein
MDNISKIKRKEGKKMKAIFILGSAEVREFSNEKGIKSKLGVFTGIMEGQLFKEYCKEQVIQSIIGSIPGTLVELEGSVKVDGKSQRLKIQVERLSVVKK